MGWMASIVLKRVLDNAEVRQGAVSSRSGEFRANLKQVVFIVVYITQGYHSLTMFL